MHEVHAALKSFYISVSILLLFLVFCCWVVPDCKTIWFRFWTWFSTRIFSAREEKAHLTRSKVYNANGYLVNSDSDIHLDCTGSFKRFDSVDRDFKINLATTSLAQQVPEKFDKPQDVPSQNESPTTAHKAPPPTNPVKRTKTLPPIIREDRISKRDSDDVLTIAIPRPKSSMSVAELAAKSNFPISLMPPPPGAPPRPPPPSPVLAVSYSLDSRHQQYDVDQQLSPCSASTINQPEEQEIAPSATLKRALSCDSVCSDSSVVLGDLEEPNVTGYLCLGLEYDSEMADLIVNVLEAKDLISPNRETSLIDTYVKIYFLPDKVSNAQTRLYKGSNSPTYKERFLFSLHPREQMQKALCFHVYSMDQLSHTLIGEGEIRLCDISLRQPVTTWVTLTDTGQKGTEFGEILFSLSYLPTAERLTIVIVKARNLKFENDDIQSTFVKVYLLQQGKKIYKKKTSIKKQETSPIFNESMIFNVPAHTLQTIQLRVTVLEANEIEPKSVAIGHVIIGSHASGRSLNHWNQMLTALRKPVAMWHPLRK